SHYYVLGTFIGAGVAVLFWLLTRRRLWSLLNPKVKKRLQTLAEQVGDKQPFAPYVLVGFLLASVWIQ
ncbi:prepilin peptidase, partial [Pseudomonas shirazensis]